MYLTPASIGYLTQLVLALTIMGYFSYHIAILWRRGEKSVQALLLSSFFASVAAVVLLFFLDAALPPSPRLYAVYLENTVIGLFLTLLTQFAYHFPRLYPQRKWEARIALALNLSYTLWEAGFAVYRGRLLLQSNQVVYRPIGPDYALVLCFLLVLLAFLRQTIVASRQAHPEGRDWLGLCHLWRPHGQAARAVRALVFVFSIPLALSLVNVWRATYAVSPAVFQSSMSAGILLTQFLFVLIYLNAVPEMASFQVRLVGIVLVTILAVFGTAGWVMTPPHAAVYQPALADQQTLRFTPNAIGGYDVAPAEFRFDTDIGSALDLMLLTVSDASWERVADIPFTFPFYGETVETIWVMQSGAVGVGAPVYYRSMEYHYATTPAIFPLFLALNSQDGGDVFARNEGERLTITWYRLPAVYHPKLQFTFQLVLYRDGVFEITITDLPDLPYDPDSSPFADVWVMGASPGTPGQSPQRVDFTRLPLQGGPEGMIQDHYLAFRRHLHQLLLPLAYLILAGSLFVVVGLPIAFYSNLIKSLNVLLEGVKRVNAGDLEVAMPVQHYDEIGFLTQAFNDMVAQLRELVTGLETRVAARTADLERATLQAQKLNIQLEQGIAEREQLIADLRDFSHTVAHDLRNPLSLMIGYASLLLDALTRQQAHQQTQLAESLIRSGFKMNHIIDELLTLASVQQAEVETEPLDMAAIVAEVEQRLALDSEQTKAQIIKPDHWPVVLGNPIWVEQVWVNYISNAIKYGGSPPRVELGYSILEAGSSMLDAESSVIQQPVASIQFWVRDNGPGIDPQAQARLFAPFSRLDSARTEGQGLGLSIVKRMVEKMGGKVGVESVLGEGCLFFFTLPALPPS